MKTFGKLSFGMSVVNLAKRGVVAEPELIANTTPGSFRLTAPVTRALGIASGDYVMFVGNTAAIDMAIAQKDEELVAWCQENNIDITSPAGIDAIHEAFDMWAVAKGIQEFDAKGNPVKVSERWTKDAKMAYVANDFDNIFESAKANGDADFVTALTAEGMTKEAQIEMIANSLQPEIVDKYRGAKCANPSKLVGIGNVVTFADASVWSALKANMGETMKSHSRIFSVDITELMDVVVNDGCKDVTIKAAVLKEYRDVESTRKKDNEEGENDETSAE